MGHGYVPRLGRVLDTRPQCNMGHHRVPIGFVILIAAAVFAAGLLTGIVAGGA